MGEPKKENRRNYGCDPDHGLFRVADGGTFTNGRKNKQIPLQSLTDDRSFGGKMEDPEAHNESVQSKSNAVPTSPPKNGSNTGQVLEMLSFNLSMNMNTKKVLNISGDKALLNKDNNTLTCTCVGNVIATIKKISNGTITATVTSTKASISTDENRDIKEGIFEGDVYLASDNFNCTAKKVIVRKDETIVEEGTLKSTNSENVGVAKFQRLKLTF